MNILKNKIVHCETEEQAKKLMLIAEDEGYIWYNKSKPTSHTCWDMVNEQGIVYFFDDPNDMKILYDEYLIAKEEGYEIIEFSNLIPLNYVSRVKVTKYNTTLGEKILVKDYEDDDWQERYFLTAAHGYVYATATEDGKYPFAWKYGIKKEVK